MYYNSSGGTRTRYGKFRAGTAFASKFFTLIELMLVITIIIILAGMLLPVLQKVKKKTYSITCKSNLKQIGIGQVSYSSDFYDYITPSETDSSFTVNWFNLLLGKTGCYPSTMVTFYSSYVGKYPWTYGTTMRKDCAFACPAENYMTVTTTHYIANGYLCGQMASATTVYSTPRKVSNVTRPSIAVYVGDSKRAIPTIGYTSRFAFRHGPRDDFRQYNDTSTAIASYVTSASKTNVLFLDGHSNEHDFYEAGMQSDNQTTFLKAGVP